ncbi:MAG TPA: FtsH protease activity modulator HflK [Pirellulales bacterium]|nr:FtsH protease activity modulator HflK [Pirellulales bacterium]
MKRFAALAALGLVAYAATGLSFVQPDEQLVVRRFGAMQSTPREPGARFGLPWGFDRIDRLKPREIKRVTIGPADAADKATGARPSQFLTGDRNLVNARATVQFTVNDPRRFLFQSAAVDRLVATAGETAISDTLAGEPVDRVLTLGKQELGVRLTQRLQALVDRYALGVSIRSVDIGSIEPPAEVADAFDKVVSAQREREQAVNRARSFSNKILAEARGAAQRIIDQGSADRDRSIRRAQGEAARFESLLTEYRQSPALTASRLYLEAMAETLPKLRSKLIVDEGSDVDLSILQEDKR